MGQNEKKNYEEVDGFCLIYGSKNIKRNELSHHININTQHIKGMEFKLVLVSTFLFFQISAMYLMSYFLRV